MGATGRTSPSEGARWLLCPVQLVAKVPPFLHATVPHSPASARAQEPDDLTIDDLSQYRRQCMDFGKKSFVYAAWAAPPTPADAPVAVDLSDAPNPFQPLRAVVDYGAADSSRPDVQPPAPVEPLGMKCPQCGARAGKRFAQRFIECDACHTPWHHACAGLSVTPRANSWVCADCR